LNTKEEDYQVYKRTIGAGKRTKQCKPWVSIATKFREKNGIDAFNDLLEEFDKRLQNETD
tara:strand:+ start:498 stop:677 length:180 start_codon:yes stop_codon:yes gene_type:complete